MLELQILFVAFVCISVPDPSTGMCNYRRLDLKYFTIYRSNCHECFALQKE